MLAARGSVAGSILTTGPISTNCQSGRSAAAAAEQRDIHPLVDHAEEAEARARDRRLVRRDRLMRVARAREVRDVDAARERRGRSGAGARFASYRLWPPVKTTSASREQRALSLDASSAGAPAKADSSSMQS